MALQVLLLIGSLIIILAGAEIFTNSVEWLGKKLNLGAGAVGSVFAAVGTALPETLIPIIAIMSGSRESGGHDVGIGAILGAPFMLATLAMFVTGLTALIKRRNNSPMRIIPDVMKRDMRFFMLVYAIAILASFIPLHQIKVIVVIFLAGAYFLYVYQTVKSSIGKSDEEGEELKHLYFLPKNDDPPIIIVFLQVAAALALIVTGAYIFVGAVQVVALFLGVPVLILSLIIAPIATELPEKFNSIIWVSRGKDTLAVGNITGAMVFQSSIIPAIGILLTEWQLEPVGILSAVLALIAVIYQYAGLVGKHGLKPSHMVLSCLFYVVFIMALVLKLV